MSDINVYTHIIHANGWILNACSTKLSLFKQNLHNHCLSEKFEGDP